MKQYQYVGLDIVEDCDLIWKQKIRHGESRFSTIEGEICYEHDVKFSNRYDNKNHYETKNELF